MRVYVKLILLMVIWLKINGINMKNKYVRWFKSKLIGIYMIIGLEGKKR